LYTFTCTTLCLQAHVGSKVKQVRMCECAQGKREPGNEGECWGLPKILCYNISIESSLICILRCSFRGRTCFHGLLITAPDGLLQDDLRIDSSISYRLHFSFHNRLSSHSVFHVLQICAATNKSGGSRNDNTWRASSLGSRDMKSLWNCGLKK
jgi:hypothetical protein